MGSAGFGGTGQVSFGGVTDRYGNLAITFTVGGVLSNSGGVGAKMEVPRPVFDIRTGATYTWVIEPTWRPKEWWELYYEKLP